MPRVVRNCSGSMPCSSTRRSMISQIVASVLSDSLMRPPSSGMAADDGRNGHAIGASSQAAGSADD
ncbi:MAG: hypothetical protein AW07_03015 [Candidatus Accumulibacter sp. SK-11]|nr:MAG: hypothetical protein AW07_03015 [Candidatus Accumulibacter sp. SK-11]